MKKENHGQYAINCYLDYLNNYLTVDKIAEDYGYEYGTMKGLINRGRDLYNNNLKTKAA